VDAGFATLGAAICWENYMPLFRQSMYAKGVQIWCAPTVDDREQWQATMRHIALEGRCFVVSANQHLTDGDTVLINGGSTIVSPLGDILAGPLRTGEGVLLAELDLDDLGRGYFDFDSAGHYARPDIFTLTVDESPRQTVVRRS
jgi:nitrilase